MGTYKKLNTTVQAVLWDGTNTQEVYDLLSNYKEVIIKDDLMQIIFEEDDQWLLKGQYLVKQRGEFYSASADKFEQEYIPGLTGMELMQMRVDGVLNGEYKECDFEGLNVSAKDVEVYLESKDLERDDQIDYNGWAGDFFREYYLDNKCYSISGSAWFNTLKFSINEP